jgi:hypothetical protein
MPGNRRVAQSSTSALGRVLPVSQRRHQRDTADAIAEQSGREVSRQIGAERRFPLEHRDEALGSAGDDMRETANSDDVLGAAGALATGSLVRSRLYGVSALDPVAFGGAALLLLATMILASLAPARRAARVDPIEVLREE